MRGTGPDTCDSIILFPQPRFPTTYNSVKEAYLPMRPLGPHRGHSLLHPAQKPEGAIARRGTHLSARSIALAGRGDREKVS